MKEHPELLLNRYAPKSSRFKKKALAHLLEVWEVLTRIRNGFEEAGDRFALMRNLLNLVGTGEEGKRSVRLIMELATGGESAVLPWHLKLERRKKTAAMRSADRKLARESREWSREMRDQDIFLRVLDCLKKTGCSLDEAYSIVARGADGPRGLLGQQPRVHSRAVVKRAYEERLKAARESGRVARPVGMFATRTRYTSLPPLRGRGRPRKKGSPES